MNEKDMTALNEIAWCGTLSKKEIKAFESELKALRREMAKRGIAISGLSGLLSDEAYRSNARLLKLKRILWFVKTRQLAIEASERLC